MTAQKSRNPTVDVVVEGVHLKFETDPRLFSPQGVDDGTACLLTHVYFHENDKVLDLGCGYGAIGIYAAKRINPTQVFLVDNDPAAVSCAMRNAQLNAVESIHIQCSDGLRGLGEKDFTKILCNPPYHTDFSVAKHRCGYFCPYRAGGGPVSLDTLGDLANVGSLTAFALVCITVIYLRISEPGLLRPFKTPLYPLTSVRGATMCVVLLLSLMATPTTRKFFLIYLAVGTVIYFLYGIRKSELGRGIVVRVSEAKPMELPHISD